MKKLSVLLLAIVSLNTHARAAEWKVGTSVVDLQIPVGVPLGGHGDIVRREKYLVDWGNRHKYTRFFKPSVGMYDPIQSTALVASNGSKKIAFVSLDVVGVTSEVVEEIRKRTTGLGIDGLYLTATHTHSGPGALSKSWVWQIIAMDTFKKEIYKLVVDGITKSLVEADSRMEPAQLFAGSFTADEISVNRRQKVGETEVDKQANLLLAKAKKDGFWLGGILNFAVHPLAHSSHDMNLSSDVAGGFEREFSRKLAAMGPVRSEKPAMLFINGAEGDVTVKGKDGETGHQTIDRLSASMADQSSVAFAGLRELSTDLVLKSIKLDLGPGKLNLDRCVDGSFFKKLNWRIQLGKKPVPRIAHVSQVQIGDVLIMTWPGEPTTPLGLAAKEMARKAGHRDPWNFGLTNGHMGYFVTSAQFYGGGYEPCVALHGAKAGGGILSGHKTLLAR